MWGEGELSRLLGKLKNNSEAGRGKAGKGEDIEELNGGEEETRKSNEIFYRRHQKVCEALNQVGWNLKPPQATFYVWAPVPPGHDSISFASLVLDQVGVVITPGVGFGAHGEGYFRLSVTAPEARLDEALDRLRNLQV